MAANTLNILQPSVNNLTARIFVRAAGLEFEERDVWGKTRRARVPRQGPRAPDADARGGGPPARVAVGELRDHGLPVQQARARPLYPTDPGERAMVDSANFYLIGTLYPLVARATYPALGFPQYPGEVATSEAGDELKAQAQRDAQAALAEPLDVYRAFFLDGRDFIGGSGPSIADIRFAATLEFLRAIDYPFPDWAEAYMARMEDALGEAYSEPVGGCPRLRRIGEGLAGAIAVSQTGRRLRRRGKAPTEGVMPRELEPWGGELRMPNWMRRLMGRGRAPEDTPELVHERRNAETTTMTPLMNLDRAVMGPWSEGFPDKRRKRC